MISLVVAIDSNYLIGRNNDLPWERLPRDMQHFRDLTLGKTILMGRKTFDSIGKPLPQRENIVLTRDQSFHSDGVKVVHSIDEALALKKDIVVIGGSGVYKDFVPHADILYLTRVNGTFEGNVHFPKEALEAFTLVSQESHTKDEKNAYDLAFERYEKIKKVA